MTLQNRHSSLASSSSAGPGARTDIVEYYAVIIGTGEEPLYHISLCFSPE